MKKFFNAAAFLVAVCVCAGILYYVIMKVEAGYEVKLIFSGALLLLALIAALIGTSSEKNRQNDLIASLVEELGSGIAIYYGSEAVCKTKRFVELEAKAGGNILKIINENTACDSLYIRTETVTVKKKEYLYVTVDDKSDFIPKKTDSEETSE